MKKDNVHITQQWQKATVAGSIWAANEIVLGSFLHNLKVPLSGTIMAFLSVIILISFCELWKDKHIIWRAGIIAALMKSISPSALILGPMVGILMEAFMLYLGMFLFGRNLLGYAIGGSLASLAVIFQKAGRLLLIYGMDLMEIIRNMLLFTSEKFGLHTENPQRILLVVILFYITLGLLAGFIGFFTGKKAREYPLHQQNIDLLDSKNKGVFKESSADRYSFFMLIFNIMAVVAGMYLLNSFARYTVLIFHALFFALVFARYKNTFQKFKKLLFWIWFIAITFSASYFLGGWQHQNGFNVQGLKAGLFMNVRAATIIIGFAVISTELRNPLIKSLLYRKQTAALYKSLEIAFGLLPSVIESLPRAKQLIKSPLKTMVSMVCSANTFLTLTAKTSQQNSLLMITGDVQQGKTSLLKSVLGNDKTARVNISGFLSEVTIEKGQRTGYRLCSIRTGDSKTLCKNTPVQGRIKYGRFYFNSQAFDFGKKIIESTLHDNNQLLIVDEIGPLELKGKGWAESIDKVLQHSSIPMIWIVRKTLVKKVIEKWGIGNVKIIDVSIPHAKEQISSFIENHINVAAHKHYK